MSFYYYLNDDHTIRPCSWGEWHDQIKIMIHNDTKRVAQEKIGEYWILTTWMGTADTNDGKEPLLFETIIFSNDPLIRIPSILYSTWDAAIEGHKKAVEWVKKEIQRMEIHQIERDPIYELKEWLENKCNNCLLGEQKYFNQALKLVKFKIEMMENWNSKPDENP